MAQQVKQQGSVQHKCPNCGASLRYDPSTGRMKCNHCKSLVAFDKDAIVAERSFEELYTEHRWKESDVASYRCQNCGAVSVAPRTTLATTCPYCNSPVIVQDATGTIVKPDTVIPFDVSAENAAAQLNRWRRKRFWAPGAFKKHTEAEAIKGVYVPVWTFDADTETEYSGRLGKIRTRTVRRNGKTYSETYTEWFRVSGIMPAVFDDIVIRANEHLTDAEFNVLLPFDQTRYMSFDDEYLAGYIADHYTLDPHEAFQMARAKMLANVRRRIVDYYNADVEGDLDLNLHITSRSFKYLLAPVYVATTKYKGKVYRQYVSGAYRDREKKLCKVSGSAPKSKWKIALAVLLALGVAVGLGFLFFWLWKSGNLSDNDGWEHWDDWMRLGSNYLIGKR
ncbi:MAG: hypothetical protein NC132_02375 [Corallococcus sp.]|nr:hypothetical protein [Corallococcus sp.]MCM1358955.1 hypothetical protein [Corallococcus sp.]MCM1394944.1 hypothetical protein [Corallococcus sp.]